MTDNLAPPGSSQYSSNTMFVGDGTWDSTRNSFLLPNLQGLNFETMRYNGMGNRFAGLPEYHHLILGHGVLAAITFIGIVPLAIFLAKYGSDWPGGRVSFKLHVYLQILTVFLSTVILVLGWFAVGPERSLTNPHHGIGVAIYTLILVQFLYGSLMYRHERKRTEPPQKLPLPVYIHRLIGRSTALLAFVQIGLGLTLYGSPKVLFILYALAGFFLLFMYLALEYYYKGGRPGREQPEFYSDYGTDISGSAAPPPRRRKEGHHWGRDLLAAGGVFGAYEWWKHRRERKREEREEKYEDSNYDSGRPPPAAGPPPVGGPPPSGGYGPPPHGGYPPQGPPPVGYPPGGGPPPGPGYGPPPVRAGAIPRRNSRLSRESWEDEKYSEPQQHTWRNRILGATGAFAAYEGAKSLFGRRRRRDSYSSDGYDSRLGPDQNHVSRADVSRVEAGEAPMSPDTPRVNMGGVQPMTPTMTPSRPPRGNRQGGEAYESQMSFDDGQSRPMGEGDGTLRDSIAILGPIQGFREWNRQRRARRQADRDETIRRQELESEEAFNRRNSNRYPRPQDANQRRPSMSGTLMTGPSAAPDPNVPDSRSNLRPDTSHPPLPAAAGAINSNSQQFSTSRQNITTAEGYSIPPPPPGPPPNAVRPDGYSPPQFGSAQMPEGAVQPDPSRLVSDNTAANESSAYGRDPPSSGFATTAGTSSGAAATVAAAAAARDTDSNMSPSRAQGSRNRLHKRGSVTSGSVSQLNSGVAGPSGTQGQGQGQNLNSPPVSVRVTNDGQNWTFQRLNEEQAAAERAARRQQRRDRRRRGSSLSSGVEDEAPPGRYRRNNGPMRPSNTQPITNIPPPPAMSSSAGASQRRESELNLPPPPPVPQHSVSPQSGQGASPPGAPPINESAYGSPGDAGTGTESAFDSNRKRRRAERARLAAQQKNRVEFE